MGLGSEEDTILIMVKIFVAYLMLWGKLEVIEMYMHIIFVPPDILVSINTAAVL